MEEARIDLTSVCGCMGTSFEGKGGMNTTCICVCVCMGTKKKVK